MVKFLKSVVLFFLFAHLSFSQNQVIKGVVKDIVSQELLAGVQLNSLKTNYATITNDEGSFEFNIPQSEDKIRLSLLGYTDLEIRLSQNNETVFYLEPKTNDLEEVIVIKDGVQDLIERLIKTSKERFTTPIAMQSYFREFVKVNNRYTKFSDGDLLYMMDRKRKKLTSSLNVKQARAYKIPKSEDDVSDDTFDDMNSAFRVDELPSSIENFRYLERTLLKNRDFKDYEFLLKSKVDPSGKKMMTLYFNTLESVEEYLYEGFITYDPETNLIHSISFTKDKSKLKYLTDVNVLLFRLTFLDFALNVNYKIVNDNYVMSNFKVLFVFNVKNKKKYNHDIEIMTDMVVTNFSMDTSKFDDKNIYKGKSLFEFGTNFNTPFWKNNNAILLTNKEEAIIKSLEETSK